MISWKTTTWNHVVYRIVSLLVLMGINCINPAQSQDCDTCPPLALVTPRLWRWHLGCGGDHPFTRCPKSNHPSLWLDLPKSIFFWSTFFYPLDENLHNRVRRRGVFPVRVVWHLHRLSRPGPARPQAGDDPSTRAAAVLQGQPQHRGTSRHVVSSAARGEVDESGEKWTGN